MNKAIELIKEFEGLRLSAYRCDAGVWTIGWGHTSGVRPEMKISAEHADELLRADVECVNRSLTGIKLTENQRAALISFGYNVGVGAMMRSTLMKLVVNDASDRRIAAEFAKWKYAGGKVLSGLVRRRKREAEVYFGV